MQATTEIPENYLSYSRFELFIQCPAKFYHRYVGKSAGKQDPESPAILGSL
ncbi:MAG: PD-(D/E)XK nuclease family protein, partial [Deltaproteobacteria bacterium]|nr:PD-(D/E)XK nuclease family protein [Deltaproteobacteria bacterium]